MIRLGVGVVASVGVTVSRDSGPGSHGLAGVGGSGVANLRLSGGFGKAVCVYDRSHGLSCVGDSGVANLRLSGGLRRTVSVSSAPVLKPLFYQ